MNVPNKQGAPDARKNFLRWLFEDRKSGRIVIAQFPNALMWLVLVALAVSFVLKSGPAGIATRLVLYGSLALWALDEIIRGVNPWRRILGLCTLVAMGAWLAVLGR